MPMNRGLRFHPKVSGVSQGQRSTGVIYLAGNHPSIMGDTRHVGSNVLSSIIHSGIQ